jgi:lecithin-cholesterol acyltransferase
LPYLGRIIGKPYLGIISGKPFLPMPRRFSEQPGVTVTIKNYGMVDSSPVYEPFYAFLEANGYTRNQNIRVAGYDWRLTPDMAGFLRRTIHLIEQTYKDNGNTPVHLVGHSNGPVYAQYLLTHTTQAWKNKYIHGFTPIAGNWPGQGSMYSFLFTGFDVNDAIFPLDTTSAAISALMFQSQPATYMSAADPAVFKSKR